MQLVSCTCISFWGNIRFPKMKKVSNTTFHIVALQANMCQPSLAVANPCFHHCKLAQTECHKTNKLSLMAEARQQGRNHLLVHSGYLHNVFKSWLWPFLMVIAVIPHSCRNLMAKVSDRTVFCGCAPVTGRMRLGGRGGVLSRLSYSKVILHPLSIPLACHLEHWTVNQIDWHSPCGSRQTLVLSVLMVSGFSLALLLT